MKLFITIAFYLLAFSTFSAAAETTSICETIPLGETPAYGETTPYGKIVGLETRSWGMHIQVNYTVGERLGCKVDPGSIYMLDLHKDKVSQDGHNFDLVQSLILEAYMGNKDVSFHLYECSAGRPIVGHVRVRN